MNFSKLGNSNWIDPVKNGGKSDVLANPVTTFLQDMEKSIASSDELLLRIKPSKKLSLNISKEDVAQEKQNTLNTANTTSSLPQLKLKRHIVSSQSTGLLIGGGQAVESGIGSPHKKSRVVSSNPLRKQPPGISYSVQERPANRSEMEALDRELESRVRTVLYKEASDLYAVETGDLHQPHRDQMLMIRDQMLAHYSISVQDLIKEQWLEKLIKCECLRDVCDHVASVLNDMLSVSSSELGGVVRKLRYTYKQAFEQMHASARQLFQFYEEAKSELSVNCEEIGELRQVILSYLNNIVVLLSTLNTTGV